MTQDTHSYQIEELLKKSPKSVIYLASRIQDRKAVVIKTLRDDYPSRQQVARLQHEFEIHQNLNAISGVAQAYELIELDKKPALVMEYVSGGELLTMLASRQDELIDTFFKLAIQITQALGEIHQHYFIHKDLNPSNILWDADSKSIKIIDFGIATELSREKQNQNSHLLKGSLAYISPEQTGRMNRSIDYRSDYYSLGVTLYQLLSGELPYDVDDDPMSWVHCHIAREPKPLPDTIEPTVVAALTAIIDKLLAKNAEDRYQSAVGICSDLEYCYQQWQEFGVIEQITAGKNDKSDRFEIQQKLYGRDEQVNTLMAAFSETTAGGCQMFLVSGFSGIGKSALINEVHKPIVAQHGYFITGKFDQFQRNIPYSAMATAFRGLMQQLLIETPENLEKWKQKLLHILGPNGQVLIDFLPELEQIIGPQAPVPHLGVEENQNRFNGLALQFVLLFTRKQRPLVLFIDDLQWVDSASLNLIKLFMLSKEHKRFLFIGAYRNNEVDEHHAFLVAVNELRKAGVVVSDLVLEALKLEDCNALIADSLFADSDSTLALAELVMQKTAGNPFFINQFLKNTYETECLSFDLEKKNWVWDLAKIEQQQSSDNVVELVVAKMERLPEATQSLLMLGACIGNVFDLYTLSVISEKSLVSVANGLWPAVQPGLLLTDGDGHILLKGMTDDGDFQEYPMVQERFLHDRVQQAAYSLINDDQKQQVHLSIARLLLQETPEYELDNHCFDIVEHYNKSIDLISDADERCGLAELNLRVGLKAKEATAYAPALRYFDCALSCLENMQRENLQGLKFDIDKGRVECLFLLSENDKGLQLVDDLLTRCVSIEDKVELNNILILYYGGAGQMDKSIDIALESLRYFGVLLPRNPSTPQLLIELARAKIHLGIKSIDDLKQLPIINDGNVHIVFSLLKELIAPTYLQGLNNLLPYIILRMFNLTLQHGNGPVSAFTYSAYALLWSKMDGFTEAYRFAVLAMQYNKEFENPPMEARCYFMATSFALFWKQSFADIQQPRKIGLQKLVDTGEYFWASYIYLFGFWQEVVLSDSIDDLLSLSKREIQFAQKAKQIEPFYVHSLHRNLFMNLAGLTANRESLDFNDGDERDALAYFERNKTSTMGTFYHVVCRLILHYHYGQYQQAIDIAQRQDISEDVIRDGTFTRVIFTFFTCLSVLGMASHSVSPAMIYKHYNKRRNKLKQWYNLFPHNFSCMWFLLLAKESCINGAEKFAIDNFELALSAARNLQSLFFESLVKELYAKFWLQRNNQKVAAVFMSEAGYLYYRWGAAGKVKYLEQQYAELFTTQNVAVSNHTHAVEDETSITDNYSFTTAGSRETSLDLNTLVKASKVLSGEIVMEKLLQKLMHFLIETAGAQKGIILLLEQEQLLVVTECSVEQGHETISQQALTLEESDSVSQMIVRYVARSKELLVLDDASMSERFAMDDYVLKHNIRSVLCMPLLNKGHLIGVLYLENNLASNSFTPDRVDTLQVLSSEIVISLENARLYRNLEEYNQTLEQKVKDRTMVLRTVNETLQAKNTEIQESKQIIEEKSNNITKSILYAQKIQHAMLPQTARIADKLKEFFILFKPKEIVSGDFYWFNSISDKQFLVVADCTGHGVPGAFLSMIGNMLLNKIILEKQIFSPAAILEVLHEEMKLALRQEGKVRQANDGMDVAICRLDLALQSIIFAGARRPLYLYLQAEQKLLKIPGDRKSVGGRQKEGKREFTEHKLKFTFGDMLYLCSDGFVDQQNATGKKFGSLQLEALLTDCAPQMVIDQEKMINQALESHQMHESQRDDITLLGVKLNAID